MKKGLLYAIIASVLWAIVNPFIKQGFSYGFTPMNFAGMRFMIAGAILLIFTWHPGMWREIWNSRKLFSNLIVINMFLGYVTFYFGVDFVSSAVSSIVMGLTPLVNVFLAHLIARNDKLNVYKVVSLVVSLAGLLLIVGMGEGGAPLDGRGILGIVLLLLSILLQGYSAIKVAEERKNVNPVFLNAVQTLFGGIMLYMVGVATEGVNDFTGQPGGFYVSFIILILISIFAFNFWFKALREEGSKVSDLNMCRLINPILGAVLSWIMIAGERPMFSTVVGMIIISTSLVIYFKGEEIVARWRSRRLGRCTKEAPVCDK